MPIRTHQIAVLLLACQAWAADRFPDNAEFNAVDGVARELMVAVGNHGLIVHFPPGGEAQYLPSRTEQNLLDVHVGSRDFAVAVGPGVLLRWDGQQWAHVEATPVMIGEGWTWATPDQGLILYGGQTEHAYRVCPWLAEAARQPFCRIFDAPVRAACGHRDQVLLLLANGDIHKVNDTLIGSDANFLPVYRPASPLQLIAAWLTAEDCDPAGGLPEIFAIGSEGAFVHFDGVAWEPLDEFPANRISGRALADHALAFFKPTLQAEDNHEFINTSLDE